MRTRFFIIISLLLSAMAFTGCGASKPKDPQQAYEDSISNIVAKTLMQKRDFVLTANRMTLGRSGMLNVYDNLNFIYVHDNECTIQLSLNYSMFSPFTARGTISNYEYKDLGNGGANVSFRFNGRIGSGSVSISLYKDSDLAVAYVDATFRRGRAAFYGPIRSTSQQVIKIMKPQPSDTQ